MLSKPQFGSNPALTTSKQAMPEDDKYDGPAGLEVSAEGDKLAANSHLPLPKPGFGS